METRTDEIRVHLCRENQNSRVPKPGSCVWRTLGSYVDGERRFD